MPAQPDRPSGGTKGTIHIVRQNRADVPARPSGYLISFGGKQDGVGAFYLGKAFNLDDLIKVLAKTGVSADKAETAAQALMTYARHEIPNVTLTRVFLRNLGL